MFRGVRGYAHGALEDRAISNSSSDKFWCMMIASGTRHMMRGVMRLLLYLLGAWMAGLSNSHATAHEWNVTSCDRYKSKRAQYVIETVNSLLDSTCCLRENGSDLFLYMHGSSPHGSGISNDIITNSFAGGASLKGKYSSGVVETMLDHSRLVPLRSPCLPSLPSPSNFNLLHLTLFEVNWIPVDADHVLLLMPHGAVS